MSKIDEIHALAIRTANDVGWVRETMKDHAKTMDEHRKAITALQHRQHWYSGIAAGIGTLLGVGGSHVFRVLALAAALTMMMPATAGSDEVTDRRAAILRAVRSIGVYPGAELSILNNVYRVETVEVDARYTITVRTKLIR